MYSRTALQGYLQDDAQTQYPFLTSDMSIAAARIYSLNSSLLKKFTGEIDQKVVTRLHSANFLSVIDVVLPFDSILNDYLTMLLLVR